jgi:7-cyano-7-deazaguanine synthase in queuosine biosynthesis
MQRWDIIIGLSGGLDSTYALWKWALDNPGKSAYVIHVNLLNFEGRGKYEQVAARDIVRWIRANTAAEITLKEPKFDYGGLPISHDISVVAFFAGVALRHHKERVGVYQICASADDFLLPGYKSRANHRFEVLKASAGFEPQVNYPIRNLARVDMINELPLPLLDLIHYCRRPRHHHPEPACGECRTCLSTQPHIKARKLAK